ncbi:MAG: PD-(D/E)XK motif protein [Deferribacteres bacterium]|nr:PD-(D/E)XK motif protein [Deferribacteres bacterium]
MKIERIWKELEDEQPVKSGLLYKRYSGAVKPDVYVALKAPERLRCIAAHLNALVVLQVKSWDKLRDVKIETVPDEKHSKKQFLLVLLLNNQHRDIFSALCEDLIQQIVNITQESELIKQLLLRLEKWRLLFEKLGRQGLSDKAQRGLYGELYFLRKFLTNVPHPDYCINSWKGVEKSVQDFQFADWAVEVKTTHGKNQQKLHISNERQLDISLVPRIFLVHYSLEVRQNYGETLNSIADNLMELLLNNLSAYNALRIKLLEAGYFDLHRQLYNNTCYSIRQENIYRITNDFPKLTEAMIPSGVGDVRYSLVISANEKWVLQEELLFKNLYEGIGKHARKQ